MLRCSTYIIVLAFLVLSSANMFYESNCPDPTEFRCNETTCISLDLVCDGKADCPGKKDESDCDRLLCKPPTWYRCKNDNVCIDASSICDQNFDCKNHDDEENCEDYVPHHVKVDCGPKEFKCSDDEMCVPLNLVCDGINHCFDHSDEIYGCKVVDKFCTGFHCENHHCLMDESWVCDGFDDCGDGSDELGCIHDCTLEHKKFLCADNSSCIDIGLACDGAKDCADGSDEVGQCNRKSTGCSNLKCSDQMQCTVLPTGPVCLCPSGYVYNSTTYRCEDVDECTRYGICSQGCTNTIGSYGCTCEKRFDLQSDNRTCLAKAQKDALLLFVGSNSINAIFLNPPEKARVIDNLNRVVGVTYDGHSIYWTDILHKSESIVMADRNGGRTKVLVTTGITSPEDICIDWLTGNIYFSDGKEHHIGVCSNNGESCFVLHKESDKENPRAIALYPQKGVMFWSNWGDNGHIKKASMDGRDVAGFVTSDIGWPNGLALDWPNDRLYWTDAKLLRIESIRLDGSDRRVVLSQMVDHPFSVAVFEDRIFWSDWHTKSLESCNKFSGKNREILLTDHNIFDVHVYHSAMQPKQNHGCLSNQCSHLCLLSSIANYTCACPSGMFLSSDKHKCLKEEHPLQLLIAIDSHMITMEHSTFGRPIFSTPKNFMVDIHKMAYNSINGDIFVANNLHRTISSVNLKTMEVSHLISNHVGSVSAMAFDGLANNLYWSDNRYQSIELFSMSSMHKTVVRSFTGSLKPTALAVIPEEGKMFVALESLDHTRLGVYSLNGDGDDNGHEFSLELGDFQFAVDSLLKHVFWLYMDQTHGKIQCTSYKADTLHVVEHLLPDPKSMVVLGKEVFWTLANTKDLHFTSTHETRSKIIPIEQPDFLRSGGDALLLAMPPAQESAHKCYHKLGQCSHICVSLGLNEAKCLCPNAMVFADHSNTSCVSRHECELKCGSGECLSQSKKCDGTSDCRDGSDENNCNVQNKNETDCGFRCSDGKCIPIGYKCDSENDCADGSDEENCTVECPKNMFACVNGEQCIGKSLVCDGTNDCGDNSDEQDCAPPKIVCGDPDDGDSSKFQCPSNKTMCLDQSVVCNGVKDCPLGEDEKNCTVTCSRYEFQCANGRCIGEQQVCDGIDNCFDGSDEHNCHGTDCGEESFDCLTGICIDLSRVCDGHSDCPDDHDELGDCDTACVNHPCDQYCRKTPTGPVCSCKLGYRLGANNRSCEDVNECEEYSPCAQRCENTAGSFHCSCVPGFVLHSDQTGCRAVGGKPDFLFTKFNQIRLATKYPATLSIMWQLNNTQVTGMDVNIKQNLLYVTAADAGTLYQFNMKTNEWTFANELGRPSTVAVDWVSNNVYLVDESPPQAIKVCHMTNRACAEIVRISPTTTITAITVDAYNGFLFYAVRVSRRPQSIVYRTDLDGTQKIVLLNPRERTDITKLACDPNKKLLYYTDAKAESLQSVNYIGEQKKFYFTNRMIATAVDLGLFEDTAFIVSGDGPSKVFECKLYGHMRCQVSQDLHVQNVDSIAVRQISLQPSLNDMCAKSECSALCIPIKGRSTACLCEDGSRVSGRTPCQSNSVNFGTVLTSAQEVEKSGQSGVVATTVVLLCLVILAGIGYIWYKRKLGRGKFNVSMHFENSRFSPVSPVEHGEVKMFLRPHMATATTYNEITIQSGSDNNLSTSLTPVVSDSFESDSLHDDCNYNEDMTARLI